MVWRSFFVILFFWAALTVITPILIRLSASANFLDHNGEMKNGGIRSIKEAGLMSRRSLGFIQKDRPATSPSSLPSPSPSPSVHHQNFRQTTLELEWNDVTVRELVNDGIFEAHDYCFKLNQQPLLDNNES